MTTTAIIPTTPALDETDETDVPTLAEIDRLLATTHIATTAPTDRATAPTTAPTAPDLHLALALEDIAATGRSFAADRAHRIAAMASQCSQEAAGAPPAASPRPRRLPPCPCSLGGLWKGIPARRRRHAVLCALWRAA